jgi:hypothetical protein
LLVMGKAVGTEPKALAEWWRHYFGFGPPTTELANAANLLAKPPFPNLSEQALLDRIPQRSRVACMRPSREQIESNVRQIPVTAVVCGPTRGASIVFYYQFNDAQGMNASYQRNTDISGPDCRTQPRDFHGDSAYTRDGATGRLSCGSTNIGPSLIWTDDRYKIMAFAFGGSEPPAMLDWWRFEAGPQ